jgi:uncharacterized repeat protein (TIGR01451 family)
MNPQKLIRSIKTFVLFDWMLFLAIVILFELFPGIASAGEIICPPTASRAYFQTNGPNGFLRWGDWWTNIDPDAGNQPHMFELYVPCLVPADFSVDIQLYDPECYLTGTEVDELTGAEWDNTTFRLIAPDETTEIVETTYPPVNTTSEQWNSFASFTVSQYGCGTYRIYVTTSNDDQNSFRFKIVEADPDGVADSGDEINIAPVRTAYQHDGTGCCDFAFYVPVKPDLRLSNFDMDGTTSVNYTDPDGSPIAGTVSENSLWNNGGGVPYPPPGGDLFTNPTSGWWQAEFCTDDGNQYVFYAEGAVYIDYLPHFPLIEISKDNGLTQIYDEEKTTYTIIVRNNGTGPALSVTMADTLPYETYFSHATGNASYVWIDPDEIVTWDLATMLPGQADTVSVTIKVPRHATSPIENCAFVYYSDIFFNEYEAVHDCDEDVIVAVGSIGDYIWLDSDGDGTQDSEETGLEDVILYLVDSDGDTIVTDTTDADGEYLFSHVRPGDYSVWVNASTLPQGASLTTGNHPLSVSISEGELFEEADFGYDVDMIPVELTSFQATAFADRVVLKWTTQSETENLGFNLFRKETSESAFKQINETLIRGAGTSEKRNDYEYADQDIVSGKSYCYLLYDIDYEGHATEHGPINVTAIEVPKDYVFEQNYPNPFNPETQIAFQLKQNGVVSLNIYNVSGRLVRSLAFQSYEVGRHVVLWDGKDDNGQVVASGVYVCRIHVNDFEQERKMLFTK